MKKLMLLVVLGFLVLCANAQDKQSSPKKETSISIDQTIAPNTNSAVIKEDNLLQPIKDNIKKDFSGTKFVHADKIEKNGVITYVVILKKDITNWRLTFDKDGKIISKVELKSKGQRVELQKK